MREVGGCCPLDCQDTCSWVATVDDGRVVRVAGAKAHPITRGSLCAKVNDYPQRMYAPDRLLHPLRRVGAKGSGAFERISWEAAVDEIATRFRTVIDEHGAEALLPFHYLGSMGVVQRRALHRVFHVLGASRFHGSVCGQAGNHLADEGFPTGMDPEAMVHARFVLVWGSNPLTTSHHTWRFLTEARRRNGARIVCIDPRATRTSRASDEHVRLLPGTDWALAAGMGRILIDEGLVDRDSTDRLVADLDAYATVVEPWTPERVAATCGVDPDVVVRLAREYAAARPGLIRLGVGMQQTAVGEAALRAIYALPLLAGHWLQPGGGHFTETNPVLNEAAAARPDLVPGSPRSLDMARLGETLTGPPTGPPVKGLMIWNANPAVTQPDVGRVRRGLARDDLFTVVVEHFLTDTARYADVVLPSTTQLEHFDVQGAWGHHYISCNEPAVPPLGESRSHGEIMRSLAARMGLDHPCLSESDEEIAASALPDGVSLEALRSTGWWRSPPERFPGSGQGPLRIAGVAPSLPVPPATDRLRLLTPKGHHFLNSTFANMPRQRSATGRPTLDMHPDDADARGLSHGELVELGNDHGTVLGWLRVTDDVRPGVVAMTGKWWRNAHGNGDAVVNLLSSSRWSPGGQPTYNDTWVRVGRARVDADLRLERAEPESSP